MKVLYRISILLNIIFAAYILVKGSELAVKDYLFEAETLPKQTQSEAEPVTEASGKRDKITCDTVYMVSEYDLSTGRQDVYEELLPQSFIGMTRTQLMEWMDDYNLSASLEDLEAGFVSMELLSFSPEEIRVRKRLESEKEIPQEVTPPAQIYEAESGETEEVSETDNANQETVSGNGIPYYGCILAQDGLLAVYDGERRHVILYTDISLFDLPEAMQQEILEGKYVTSEEELYHLLESYSS